MSVRLEPRFGHSRVQQALVLPRPHNHWHKPVQGHCPRPYGFTTCVVGSLTKYQASYVKLFIYVPIVFPWSQLSCKRPCHAGSNPLITHQSSSTTRARNTRLYTDKHGNRQISKTPGRTLLYRQRQNLGSRGPPAVGSCRNWSPPSCLTLCEDAGKDHSVSPSLHTQTSLGRSCDP